MDSLSISSRSPIPGAGYPPRGLFIDRWGTLLEPPEGHFEGRFERVEFTPGSLDALFHAGQADWKLYLLGNEEDVAFGRLPEARWRAFEEDLLEHLRAHGIPITRCYACLDHPQGVKPHTRDSVFLLPNTGALYHAAQFDGIYLDHCWVVGDGTLELVAGWRAGCRLAGIGSPATLGDSELQVEPQIWGESMAEVVRDITADSRVAR